VPTGAVVVDGTGDPSIVGTGGLVVDVDVHDEATTAIARAAQRMRTLRRYTRDAADGSARA
jgi:carbonic anhydrase/acetyltransferase-like protein (isoleucine patch superfamily)